MPCRRARTQFGQQPQTVVAVRQIGGRSRRRRRFRCRPPSTPVSAVSRGTTRTSPPTLSSSAVFHTTAPLWPGATSQMRPGRLLASKPAMASAEALSRAVLAALAQFAHGVARADQPDRTRARSVTSSTGLVRKSSAPASSPAIFRGRGPPERGHQKDRDVRRVRIGLEAPAHLEAGHVGHQHIEDDQVGSFFMGGPGGRRNRCLPVRPCSRHRRV